MEGLLLSLIIGIVGVLLLLPRTSPTTIIVVKPTSAPSEPASSGLGCLPLILVGAIVALAIHLL